MASAPPPPVKGAGGTSGLRAYLASSTETGPGRLVYVSSFSDAGGGIAPAPFPAIKESWPREVLNSLSLGETGGRTELTLVGTPIDATQAETDTFMGMFESMRQGFAGTFDQLEEYLARD